MSAAASQVELRREWDLAQRTGSNAPTKRRDAGLFLNIHRDIWQTIDISRERKREREREGDRE